MNALRRTWTLAICLGLIGAIGMPLLAVADEKKQPSEAPPVKNPTCIAYRGEAQWRDFGYNHVVVIDNNCDKDADCEAWTDVDPKRIPLKVEKGKSGLITTRRGSPARAFTPGVECKLK
jgi:hypothetical protein